MLIELVWRDWHHGAIHIEKTHADTGLLNDYAHSLTVALNIQCDAHIN